MKKFYRWVLMAFALFSMSGASAQDEKIVRVKGDALVRIENNETQNHAKERAEELAKLDAIQNTFGTYVEQQTDMVLEEGKVNYSIMAGTRMKADWIETTKLEFTFPEQKSGNSNEKIIYVKCAIEGNAREIRSKANIKALTLRCPREECASDVFKNNQQLFLYFRAPVDGYLSVYIDEGQITRRLLPYERMGNESYIRITGDKDYVFFENKKGFNTKEKTDEVILYTDKTEEYNNIYMIFSENTFVKPNLEESSPAGEGIFHPKSISSDDFQEWLAYNRAASTSFQDKKIRIRITKR